MKVAAYQAPVLPNGSMGALPLIQRCVAQCESEGVRILCCPEAILGGLADYADDPRECAFHDGSGALAALLEPLASATVTTIVGFTEITPDGRLYNSAAVLHRGAVLGTYRKCHPAINRSVYDAGDAAPVFRVDGLTFGILICNDSNFAEPARTMKALGASALFIPTNNALPPEKARVVDATRRADMALVAAHRTAVIRADVAGACEGRVAYGTSAIIDASGKVLHAAQLSEACLLIADIGETTG